MKKLAWLALAVFVILVVFITLGAVNYAGIGEATGSFMQNSFISPIRNYIVNAWLFLGTSGWYIAGAFIAISVFGAVFWVPIAYNLLWKKAISQKLLHRTPTVATPYQNAPSNPIPVTPPLQSEPTPAPTEKKEG